MIQRVRADDAEVAGSGIVDRGTPERPQRESGELEALAGEREPDDRDREEPAQNSQPIAISSPPRSSHRMLPMVLIAGGPRWRGGRGSASVERYSQPERRSR